MPDIVIYDACVLYPANVRDFLMWIALADIIRAKWTNQIQDEWISNLLEKRPDLQREQLEYTRQKMELAIQDCLITDYEHRIEDLELPDLDDRHVLAAAIEAGASTIVTFNLQDFPENQLRRYDIVSKHPDDFLKDLACQRAEAVVRAAKKQQAGLRKPPMSVADYLDNLKKMGLAQTSEFLRVSW